MRLTCSLTTLNTKDRRGRLMHLSLFLSTLLVLVFSVLGWFLGFQAGFNRGVVVCVSCGTHAALDVGCPTDLLLAILPNVRYPSGVNAWLDDCNIAERVTYQKQDL